MGANLLRVLAVFIVCGGVTGGQTATPQNSTALHGLVRDGLGKPVPGGTVFLQAGSPGAEWKEPILTASTDARGAYRFQGLRGGTYRLRVEKVGYQAAAWGVVALEANVLKQVDLLLERTGAGPLPQFYDEPQFTVAGVTDSSYRGGHGSDTVLRTTESLTKATIDLKQREAARNPTTEADRHHALGEAAEERGDALAAVREYRRAAELDASEPNLFNWGVELLTHRAAAPALEVFTKGKRRFPQSSRMLLGMAVASYAQGSYEEAARTFFAACDLNARDPAPYLFLGKVQHAAITGSDDYMERVRRFAVLQPDCALADYYYAVALWRRRTIAEDKGTRRQVEALLNKAASLDPSLASAHLQLGIVSADGRDFPQAIREYERAVEISPAMEEAHYRLAQVYRQAGDKRKAEAELALYEKLTQQAAAETEHERSEIRQFVIALKDESGKAAKR